MFSSHFSDAILRNEAYLVYAAVTKDEAQRRYWTFYDAMGLTHSTAMERFSNRVNSSRKVRLTVPVGPFRCLATESSANRILA